VPKDVKIVAVGSSARGTQLRGSSDLDIFLLFPRSTSRETLEKKGLEYGRKIVRRNRNETFEVKYAEHPYTKLFLKEMGIAADIVPAYKINGADEMGTAVDRTQLHNKFIKSHLSEEQKGDVRVLKAFLKAHGIYGANARVEGFSGYLCELLIHHYGSFPKLLSKVIYLKLPLVIDIISGKEYHSKDQQAAAYAKRFKSEFIVIDPTDKNRNVAAVVSGETLARFIMASRILLTKPSIDFFYGIKYSDVYSERRVKKISKELGLDIYLIKLRSSDVSEEIVIQQIRKLSKRIANTLEENGFAPIMALEELSGRDAIIAFIINGHAVKSRIIKGPNLHMGHPVGAFFDSHPTALARYFESGRIVIIEKSVHENPKELLSGMLKDKTLYPSCISSKGAKLYVNYIPEKYAKLLYSAFIYKTNV
jgi:tRNA nucleotidyltransferase (CCA-adding enzyme)